ncbi:peptidylprolyl isomerase domain and WD repeat-containing protein 1-like isoform X1 [Lytechinus pictus]|uniref:peptidylprolyl isomerase domain and WD repeat-containing protein 1-like isoform X1 n=1 Tax=Lytechinus pictus TaxID=7653 RepID=UPI00240D2DF5|nr:peptidylprolyl isomerase domain and WD repeat-containing protein 1-like [Lytechinus pictus]
MASSGDLVEKGTKRSIEEEDEDDEWIGPMPAEAIKPKKKKVLEFENVYLDNMPSAELYEKSLMHRDTITHVAATKTEFIITASCDGHVKFWKKQEGDIEFVKHFRAHLGKIQDISVSSDGAYLSTISDDKSAKIFDVTNFDMINMMKLTFVPGRCQWIYRAGDAIPALAISDRESGKIYVYDGKGTSEPLHTLDNKHSAPVILIKYNPVFEVALSVDKQGILEYWKGPKKDYCFPSCVSFEYKTDTDLYEFVKCKTVPTSVNFSPDGKLVATIAKDRKIRIFRFLTGKLTKVLDESLKTFTELQQMRQQLPDMEFGRRMAVERDLQKSDAFSLANIIFDESGYFVLYATMLGIKILNLHTNRISRIIGKQENVRFLHLSMYQGKPKQTKGALTLEMTASDNPSLMGSEADPTLVCSAFKKNRFYLFTRREPDDAKSNEAERDVFNEKPSKEEQMAATQGGSAQRLSSTAILHTTMGDVHVKLFTEECPKTIENFCVHSRNGYYNGHIFHRVIKQFMIQTGDPQGNGTGGESIWGGEFEDEFHPKLRHDRPYTLSMANAGRNTNGSQFFITVVPCPWLDQKHTVFGRVIKGMECVQKISEVKVHPKTDKPLDDIRIVSISVK